MTFEAFDYWGAYSGYPLSIMFDEEHNKLKSSWRPEVIINISFRTYNNRGYKDNVIEIRREYEVEEVTKTMNIDLTSIFKNFTFIQDINNGLDIGRFSSYIFKISVTTQYSEINGDIKKLSTKSSEFKVYASNFSFYDISTEWNGIRICKEFNGKEKPYTTYFKGFKQIDEVINIKQDNLFNYESINRSENAKYVDRVVDECGIFMAWQNTAGSWSYWLFSEEYIEELKTKSLGTLIDGYIGENVTRIHPLGLTAVKRWILKSEIPIISGELEELQSLLYSRVAFVYINNNGQLKPIRVNIVDGSYKFDINKQDTHPFSVTIEFEPLKLKTEL